MWQEKKDMLSVELEFKDFVAAFGFMVQVAELAEAHQHHPNWCNVYNKVTINLATHDAGNTVTYKDRKLAEAISLLEGFEGAVR